MMAPKRASLLMASALMISKLALAILCVSTGCCGCATNYVAPTEEPLISDTMAIEVARRQFVKLHYPGTLLDYRIRVEHGGGRRWLVLFRGQGKFERPDYWVCITVDTQTAATTVIPGG